MMSTIGSSSYYAPSTSVSLYSAGSGETKSKLGKFLKWNSFGGSHGCGNSASEKRRKFFSKLLKFRQMDFEHAAWQMVYLFLNPNKVYRNFQYRKESKNQYARDDPAFLLLLAAALFVSSLGFSLCLRLGFVGFIKLTLWVIFVDCIGTGLVVSTFLWWVANRYWIAGAGGATSVGNPLFRSGDLEWAYAFDVHLNAFFPLLMILHLFQLSILNIIVLKEWFISILIGNSLWLLALGYYWYITFLGYDAVPYLKKPKSLLLGLTALAIIYILSLALRWNISKAFCYFYEYRVS